MLRRVQTLSSPLCSLRSQSSFPTSSLIEGAEYAERREKLVQRIRNNHEKSSDKTVTVLLKGSVRSYIAPDVPHSYRQCSHFRYLTGVTVPGCFYLLEAPPNGPSKGVLFMDKRTPYEELWEGQLPSTSKLIETSGAADVQPLNRLTGHLTKIMKGSFLCFDQTAQWHPDIQVIASQCSSMTPLKTEIDHLRVVKSAAEVASMREICKVGSQMMTSMISRSRGITWENEIQGRLELEARRRGAERLAYPPVIAGGNRANVIHYMDNNSPLSSGDTVLVDAGCDMNGYVSDITRCFPVSGVWSDPQRVLYEALDYVQSQLFEYANSQGKVRLSNLYTRMVELLGGTMIECGVFPESLDGKALVKAAEELCPHHVSHYLGMDVHDCENVSKQIELPPNVVFTIEPGAYVNLKNTTCRKEFRGIGYRIEDDVMTTDNGITVLTEQCERDCDGIEKLMQ